MIYYIVPVVDVTINGKRFINRVIYECSEKIQTTPTTYSYTYTEDGVIYYLDDVNFVEVPETTQLDPRTVLEKYYDDHKQRDSDYHKVYKERMGITVRTWEEEQYLKYKKDVSGSKNTGQPEESYLSKNRIPGSDN